MDLFCLSSSELIYNPPVVMTVKTAGPVYALTRLRPLVFPGGKSSRPMHKTDMPRKMEFEPYVSR